MQSEDFPTPSIFNEERHRKARTDGRRLEPLAKSRSVGRPSLLDDPELPNRVGEALDSLVSLLRDRVVLPVEQVAATAMFVVLALIVGAAAGIMLAIGGFRLLSSLTGSLQWAAHLLLGAAFAGIGLVLSRRARSPLR